MHLREWKAPLALSGIALGLLRMAGAALVSTPGEIAAIPSWDLQSSAKTGNDLTALSKTGVDTSSWHHVKSSKCTLMGCLIESGFYNDTHLFYSDNLRTVDAKQFTVPWLYRQEFALDPAPGRHFFLQTNGITSRADIYLNGKQVADKSFQVGAYGGHTYDITDISDKTNALVIQAHPTSYYYDFALGWVDWNPWPADNGTGVWRDVEVKQTGSVALGPLRVVTQLGASLGSQPANVTLKAKAQNLEKTAVTITASGLIAAEAGGEPLVWTKTVTLAPLSTTDIVLTNVVQKPTIWWPARWGEQPLYKANLTVTTSDGAISDFSAGKFGFRTVTSQVNAFNDTEFTVNGQRFQVLGGGYAPDMFLRWDKAKWEAEAKYQLDLGFNTVRLEGKNEHPEFYEVADRLGLMVMAGWECCDKWEAWSYNNDLAVPTPVWVDADYVTANASMAHDAAMMQTHPSMLVFLIGSDYWPDDKATPMYVNTLKAADWQVPIIASASKRSYPALLGPSGLKMEGPYDWVPPNYWYDTEPSDSRLGAAFGLGSEQSAGGSTPDLSSLKKFLSPSDLDDLWKNPNKELFHMSTDTSSFHTRKIFNNALWKRWGAPTSLEDYLIKTQIMDYEANRAEFEGFSAMWNAKRPATGVIYWMLTAAFPSLHWNIWDYYMHPAGGYFGTKVGMRLEHVAYDYAHKAVYLVNHSLDKKGARSVDVQVIDTSGKVTYNTTVSASTTPNTSKSIVSLTKALNNIKDVVFLRLALSDDKGAVLSRNVYWISKAIDTLDWENSEWYVTPVTKFADYTALNKLAAANVTATVTKTSAGAGMAAVTLENKSSVPAFFIILNLVDTKGQDVVPLTWSDNYVTLWPKEKLTLTVKSMGGAVPAAVQISGKNVAKFTLGLS
ncbi:glycoside hydrolase superfamily [Apodospora peruviana]|uniref:Glycoside hydrolase superfamily n=1 Tax=Apodospora peruviana TaxID=516989 RepID=A0AAE0HXC4_9PEZI|nr:glycoside hydrolase superfamily [Apodospora peruviana]